MSQGRKPKPMSDPSFSLMAWTLKSFDLFLSPERHLKKAPLREGMTIIDYGCGPGRYTIPVAKIVRPRGKVYAVDIQHLAIETGQ